MTAPMQRESRRLYTLRLFEGDQRLSQTHFLEADDDANALSQARSMMPWLPREIWEDVGSSASFLRPVSARCSGAACSIL